MSRSVGAVRKEGWSWVTLKAWNPRLSSLLAGSPLSSVFPSNSGDDQPLSLGVTGKSVKNKGSVCGVLCGAGPYKQPLSQYMYVISIQIQATKLWMVALAGQLQMAALRRGWAAPAGLLSHSRAEEAVGSMGEAEVGEVGCGRPSGCVQTELASLILICPWCLLSP